MAAAAIDLLRNFRLFIRGRVQAEISILRDDLNIAEKNGADRQWRRRSRVALSSIRDCRRQVWLAQVNTHPGSIVSDNSIRRIYRSVSNAVPLGDQDDSEGVPF